MTVRELVAICLCGAVSLDSEVLVRLDDEALDSPRGLVFEILNGDYSFGCNETAALILNCGQPDDECVRSTSGECGLGNRRGGQRDRIA